MAKGVDSRAEFEAAFEEETGWEPDDYPASDVAELCWNIWQAAKEKSGES